MFLGRGQDQRTIVAVEISARELRVLRLRPGKPLPTIEGYERCALPVDDQQGRRETLVRSLGEILAFAREGDVDLRVTLDHPTLLLRCLHFPPMPKSEIAEAVKHHWAELTQMPLDRMAYDLAHNARKEGSTSGGDQGNDVLVAAVPREELDALVAFFTGAGVEPSAVVPAASALHALRQIEVHQAGAPPVLEMILEIGASRTALLLVQGDRFVMARDIATGGESFTHILERELGVGRDEAEKLKCLRGLSDPTEASAAESDPSAARSIQFALRSVAERLVNEVQRTVAYAQEEHRVGRLERVLLTGGGARLRGLDQMISEALETPAAIWRPVISKRDPDAVALPAGSDPEQESEVDAGISPICLGAGIRPPVLNFLSPSALARPRRPLRITPLWLAVGYAVALAAIVGWHGWAAHRTAAALDARESRLAELTAAGGDLDAIHPYLMTRGREVIDYTAMFKDLDRLAPSGVIIDSVVLQRPSSGQATGARRSRRIRIEGIASGSTTHAEANLARLLDSVEASPFFRNTSVVRSRSLRNPNESGIRFAFTCEIERSDPAGDGSREAEGGNHAGA